eukprot:18599-Heterococcus_DN1.PRE.1
MQWGPECKPSNPSRYVHFSIMCTMHHCMTSMLLYYEIGSSLAHIQRIHTAHTTTSSPLCGVLRCAITSTTATLMLGTGHATAITTAATAATAATTATSSTTTAQQQQRKCVSMMEAAQGITIALGQTVTVQLDAPPDAASRWHMPFATATVGNSPASIVSITGDSQSASTDTTATASSSSRSSAAAAHFEKSKLTGATMLHIKGLKEGRVELRWPCHPPRQRPGTSAGSNYTMRITVRAEVMSPMLQ